MSKGTYLRSAKVKGVYGSESIRTNIFIVEFDNGFTYYVCEGGERVNVTNAGSLIPHPSYLFPQILINVEHLVDVHSFTYDTPVTSLSQLEEYAIEDYQENFQ